MRECKLMKHNFFICVLTLLLFHGKLFSQNDNKNIDSLESLLKITVTDTQKISLIHDLAYMYQYSNAVKGIEYAREGLKLSKALNLPGKQAMSLSVMAQNYEKLGNYSKATETNLSALEIYNEIKDYQGLANIYNNLGLVSNYQGNYSSSIDYHLKSISISEKLKNLDLISSSLNNIGAVYFNIGKLEKALDFFMQSQKIDEERGDRAGVAKMLNNIGSVYLTQEKYNEALDYISRSLKIKQEIGDRNGVARSFGNIGNVYYFKGDYNNALIHWNRSKQIYRELNSPKGLSIMNISIAEMFAARGMYNKSIQFLDSTVIQSNLIGAKQQVLDAYLQLAENYAALKDFKNAFVYQKLFTSLKDSLLNEDSDKQISEMQAIYDTDKKEKQIEIQNLQIIAQSAEINKKQVLIYASVAGFILMLLLSVFIYNSYKQKQKANKLITIQKDEVEKRNVVIQKQKMLVEEKNKDITDSINYARKIQEAILPSPSLKRTIFPDAFVLLIPRNIVSGDFYWFAEKKDKRIIAAVDCTGHGVPGAFMSMIGNAFLNEIVNENNISNPSVILNMLRTKIINTLNQTEEDIENRDGMDIALICIDDKKNTVEFSGAYNPLWIIRPNAKKSNQNNTEVNTTVIFADEEHELVEIRGDKQPIGLFINENKSFTNNKIEIQKGDLLYIFTDGYADQFGGPKGKKFRYKQLQQLLFSLVNTSMQNQENVLLNTFKNWKGDLEQVDDVLLIGVRA